MLLTHPLPEDRITDSRARARAYPPMRVMPSIDYHLTRARIVARYAGIDGQAAMGWFKRTQKKLHQKSCHRLITGVRWFT